MICVWVTYKFAGMDKVGMLRAEVVKEGGDILCRMFAKCHKQAPSDSEGGVIPRDEGHVG